MASAPDPAPSWTSSTANVLRLGVIAATALAAAILTALGLDTAGQLRILRNNPGELAWGLVLAVIGTWLMLITLALPQPKAQRAADPTSIPLPQVEPAPVSPPKVGFAGYTRLVGGIIFLVGTLLIVYYGTTGISGRETPSLSVSAIRNAESSAVLISVEAHAPSLQSDELVLLRVMGITPDDDMQLIGHCNDTTHTVKPKPVDPNAVDPNAVDPNAVDPNAVEPNAVDQPEIPDLSNARVLYLGESGPTTTGAAKIAFDLAVPTGQFTHVCALAFLHARDHGDHPSSTIWAFARLCAVSFDPSPTPADAAAAPPPLATC